jgi:hypothetical protein
VLSAETAAIPSVRVIDATAIGFASALLAVGYAALGGDDRLPGLEAGGFSGIIKRY